MYLQVGLHSDNSMQFGFGHKSHCIPGCNFCSWKMGFTLCYLWLCSLGSHPCPFPWGSGDLVLPEDLDVVLCRLSCPDTKMSLCVWLPALHNLATHCGSKYKDRVSFFWVPWEQVRRYQESIT